MSVVRRRENPLLHNLLHLVRKQPDVRSCIQRLSNACMAGDISCKEGGRMLSPKLLGVVRKMGAPQVSWGQWGAPRGDHNGK